MLDIIELKKVYADTKPASYVRRLYLGEGSAMALKGVSGSGKSTLLNMIAGIVRPTSGEIIFRGQNICKMAEPIRDGWRAQNIGYIFQTMNLIDELTVIENVMLPVLFASRGQARGIRERAAQLLRAVCLEDRGKSRPHNLSSGERQRVAVARALINSPALVLADEPTASLDSENAELVINMLESQCAESGCSLLIASHDDKVLSRFQNIFVMERA